MDRGPASVECILIVLALKCAYPDFVFVNRGNHECRAINNENGFRREARVRLGLDAYDAFSRCFLSLPLGVVIADSPAEDGDGAAPTTRILVLHGGIPVAVDDGATASVTLDELQRIDRTLEPTRGDRSILTQVLWNDPHPGVADMESKRSGWGRQFGSDATARFLNANALDGVVRSHEEITAPFSIVHAGCITSMSLQPLLLP